MPLWGCLAIVNTTRQPTANSRAASSACSNVSIIAEQFAKTRMLLVMVYLKHRSSDLPYGRKRAITGGWIYCVQ